MTQRNISNEDIEEFQSFLTQEEVRPPSPLSLEILSQVRRDLNPSVSAVFSKLALIHVFMGTLTLLFCPQFGIALFPGMGLMGIFMKYGEQACMLGCGATFLGGSTLVASFALRSEEIRVIRETELLQLAILALASLGIFTCVGMEMVFGMALFWFLGSVLGGLATLELGWMIRKFVKRGG